MKIDGFVHWYLSQFESYKDRWNYEDGCVLKGAWDLHEATGEDAYADFVKGYVDARVSPEGEIQGFDYREFNIDNVNTGKVLRALYHATGKERYAKAMMHQYQQLLHHPRTAEGSFWHKNIYPSQVWLDGLYMAMPFYAGYLKDFEPETGFADIAAQFETVKRRMHDPETGLYYHGYDESRKERWSDPATGCSPHFWSRAMGWYVMALVDTLEVLPQSAEASVLKDQLTEAMDALMRVQDKASRMWWQVLDQGAREGNYLETSGTLMIAYALMKGGRLGVLSKERREEGEKVFQSVVESQLDLGKNELHGICGVAGLGNVPYRDGSYGYYVSERPIVNDHKGIGVFLMTYGEWIQAKK